MAYDVLYCSRHHVALYFVVVRVLPDMPLNFKGTYKGLMKSLFTLYRDNSTIRLVSARAGLCFGSFLALWACLAFKLSGEPFYAGNNIIGMLGLCGVAGALTASFVGSLVHKFGVRFLLLLVVRSSLQPGSSCLFSRILI